MTTDDERQMKHIMQHVFRYLIFQSDIGLDYMEKFEAWKKVKIILIFNITFFSNTMFSNHTMIDSLEYSNSVIYSSYSI